LPQTSRPETPHFPAFSVGPLAAGGAAIGRLGPSGEKHRGAHRARPAVAAPVIAMPLPAGGQ